VILLTGTQWAIKVLKKPLRGRNARLRLSLYADDAVIFINPIREEVTALFEILEQFGATTGLKLNIGKCTVAPIKCAEINLDHVLEGYRGNKTNFPITYLGLPLSLGRLKVVHLQKIVDKSRSRLAAWQGRLMNPAGRRELVRSVLSSMPVYLMTTLKAPKQLIADIDQMRRRFLWAGDNEISGGKCKVAWTAVAKPEEFGGLGIIDLDKFSRALRLRWLWFQWTKPERPWNGSELPVNADDVALFNAATTVTVRDGRKASFWHSSWIEGRAPASLWPRLYAHSRKKNRTVREALLNRRWVSDIAHNLNQDLLKEYFEFWLAIDRVRPALDEAGGDIIIWGLESSGQYSSKSAYMIQFAGQVQSPFPALIWKAWAPPKCKFFLWLLLKNRLWTSARLQQRHWKNNYFCALCERNLETAHHLFFECPYSRLVWQAVSSWSSCPSLQPASWEDRSRLEDCFSQTLTTGEKKAHTLAILTLWSIWNRRNAVVFREDRKTTISLVVEIKDMARQWSLAGCKALRPLMVAHVISE
jgi:hypothetical protein